MEFTTAMQASAMVTFGIPAVSLIVVAMFLWAVRRSVPAAFTRTAVGVALWLVVWGALALAGVFQNFDARPPPFALALLGVVGSGVGIAFSPLGKKLCSLPLWWLVIFHAFRLPLELVMHQAAVEGTMPNQMSFSGYNFDIVTGITALIAGPVLYRTQSRALALAWNLLGTVLLLAIVGIAVSSLPMFSAFGSDAQNTWVAYFPFIYLPMVCVAGALAGHLVLFRRLLGESG